jgi:ribosome-associated protein
MTQRTGLPIDAGLAAREAVDIASDKQASDIVLIDVRGVCGFTDYMVILSAASTRQLTALVEDLTKAVTTVGLERHHEEGTAESGWVLIDFGDVVINLFSEPQRAFYNLEQVWWLGKQVVRIQ